MNPKSKLSSRSWTKDEHEALVRLAGTLPAKTVAKKIGRSYQATQSYAERHGISLVGYWTKKKSVPK